MRTRGKTNLSRRDSKNSCIVSKEWVALKTWIPPEGAMASNRANSVRRMRDAWEKSKQATPNDEESWEARQQLIVLDAEELEPLQGYPHLLIEMKEKTNDTHRDVKLENILIAPGRSSVMVAQMKV